jgi:hypothetical protein
MRNDVVDGLPSVRLGGRVCWMPDISGQLVNLTVSKEPPYTANAMLTFRDPDNIQLEFFWQAARSSTSGAAS